jgi:hypothetical protein
MLAEFSIENHYFTFNGYGEKVYLLNTDILASPEFVNYIQVSIHYKILYKGQKCMYSTVSLLILNHNILLG